MDHTFEKDIILLMQHPIATTPIDQLNLDQAASALGLIERLIDWDGDRRCSKSDYMQMARLYFTVAMLAYKMVDSKEKVLWASRKALNSLVEGGIDLSVSRWLRLVNLKYGDEEES